jgi:putative transposase
VLDRLVTEMYARGLSTRDVEDAFTDATGQLLISKSAVSEITDRLWEDYQGFITRDLSEISVEYLFVDAIFEALRRHGTKEALCRLVHRVPRPQTLAAPRGWQQGERGVLDGVLPQHARPRAAAAHHRHLRRRARADQRDNGVLQTIDPDPVWVPQAGQHPRELPDETAAEVMAHLYAVRDAPTLDAARAAADRPVNTYGRQYPAAIACFRDNLNALLAIHRVPARHRIRVRTTNLAERSFVEERRRTKVIPRFTDERSAMKLVFATMIRAAQRWCRVSISDLERHQLKLLRTELGLDPPPADNNERNNRRKSAAA